MKIDLQEIRDSLINSFDDYIGPLHVRKNSDAGFEIAGTIEAMQGKQKVDGYYFASVVPKLKDIRLYFFPIYTHVDAYKSLSPELRKCLKGKSCFHIKKLSPEMEKEIKEMIGTGVKLYQKDGLI